MANVTFYVRSFCIQKILNWKEKITFLRDFWFIVPFHFINIFVGESVIQPEIVGSNIVSTLANNLRSRANTVIERGRDNFKSVQISNRQLVERKNTFSVSFDCSSRTVVIFHFDVYLVSLDDLSPKKSDLKCGTVCVLRFARPTGWSPTPTWRKEVKMWPTSISFSRPTLYFFFSLREW